MRPHCPLACRNDPLLYTNRVIARFGTSGPEKSGFLSGWSAEGWSAYGAWRSQPVATGGKWERPENGCGGYGVNPFDRDPGLVRLPEDNRIDHRTTRQLRGEEGEAVGDG
jgi:hypothetical protein